MQNKKCQWSSWLCLAISFPLNVICFRVSIVLSFFEPRKKEFFNSNKNCGFHDHILITATFSSIPLHQFSSAEFLTSCLCFFIFSTKIKLQSSATTHFEDNFKHFNHMEKTCWICLQWLYTKWARLKLSSAHSLVYLEVMSTVSQGSQKSSPSKWEITMVPMA